MTAPTLPRPTRTTQAKSLVPHLQLTCDGPDGAALDPVTIVGIEPYQDGQLLFTFDNGLRMPFGPDEQVTMVCAAAEHPAWCYDPAECERQRDSDGSIYHGSTFREAEVTDQETNRAERLSVSLSRVDDPDGKQGETTVHVLGCGVGIDLMMSPVRARKLAALLLEAADDAEAEYEIAAGDVRLGDEIWIADEWQTVTLLLVDGHNDEVGIYTTSDEDPAGRYDLDELVRVCRSGGTPRRPA